MMHLLMHKLCTLNRRKKKGFVITLEVMCAMVLFYAYLRGNTFLLQALDRQKFMFNSAISAASQAARWGGNNNTLYTTYSKHGMSIARNMEEQMRRISAGSNPSVTITPDVVTSGSETIHVTVTYHDVGLYGWGGRNHKIELETESIVNSGKLILQ